MLIDLDKLVKSVGFMMMILSVNKESLKPIDTKEIKEFMAQHPKMWVV